MQAGALWWWKSTFLCQMQTFGLNTIIQLLQQYCITLFIDCYAFLQIVYEHHVMGISKQWSLSCFWLTEQFPTFLEHFHLLFGLLFHLLHVVENPCFIHSYRLRKSHLHFWSTVCKHSRLPYAWKLSFMFTIWRTELTKNHTLLILLALSLCQAENSLNHPRKMVQWTGRELLKREIIGQ